MTLDPDTEQVIRARMAERGVSFKQALNDAIRESAGQGGRQPYRMQPRPMGRPKVDLTKALQLAGELEDQELIARMRRDEHAS